MRVRSITTCALGLAAALSFGASSLAAQDSSKVRKTTTSSTRIPISKESPGEVVTVRVDTVYVTRHDTVTSTILRIDTVVVTPPAAIVIPKIRNMYWGVYAGATEPWGNIDRMYTNGFHGGGVLGWESMYGMFGLRLNGDFAQINREQGRNDAIVGVGTPLLLTLGADVKVKPLSFGGWDLYGLLGGNFNAYKRIATVGPNDNCIKTINGASVDGQGGCYTPASQDWKSKFGFNLGAGTDFHIGNQDMFLEARFVALSNDGVRTWFLPLSLGVRYF